MKLSDFAKAVSGQKLEPYQRAMLEAVEHAHKDGKFRPLDRDPDKLMHKMHMLAIDIMKNKMMAGRPLKGLWKECLDEAIQQVAKRKNPRSADEADRGLGPQRKGKFAEAGPRRYRVRAEAPAVRILVDDLKAIDGR